MALSQIALTASGSKYMAATIPPTLAALWVLARFYLLTSQQLRILDIELKAPVYTALTETKDGLATIRAFGWQPQYQRACEGRIDASKRAIYMMFLIQRWLNFVLDLLVGGLATLLVALATQLRAATDPAALGVGLSSVIGLSTLIAQFIVAYTDLENQLGAVARIKDCVESIESEDAHAGAQEPPADWPNKGEVCFSNVTASYGYVFTPFPPPRSRPFSPLRPQRMCLTTGRRVNQKQRHAPSPQRHKLPCRPWPESARLRPHGERQVDAHRGPPAPAGHRPEQQQRRHHH